MSKGTQKPVNKKGVSVEEKQEANQIVDPGFSTDFFALPAYIKEELDSKGLVPRFVNTKEMERNNGYHLKGWRPYKLESKHNNSDFLFGSSADGYFRRGELVLAVKTKEEVSKHKAYLEAEANRKSVSNVKRQSRAAFRDYLKETGMSPYFKEDQNYE